MTAREAALRTLTACETQDAWAEGFLKKTLHHGNVAGRDAALATRLTFGVLQNKLLLDWHLSSFSKRPLERLEPAVRSALRLAAYQMLLMDKIPVSAAVNESVKLTRQFCKNPAAAGMVNGILRSLERARDSLPAPDSLSLRYSHPQWLVDIFSHRLEQPEVEALLACHNEQAPVVAQVNTCISDTETVTEDLRAAGTQVLPHPWLPDCLILSHTGDLEQLDAFRRGRFYIQDAAARLSVMAAAPAPGMRVLDVCAAPGGKSFGAAVAMQNRGEVHSCDIHPHKIQLIEKGAERLGLTGITARLQNAKEFVPEWAKSFDCVIADVPCSGLGIIRKKPDIRYKPPGPLKNLPKIQQDILRNVCAYVKPGGTLLYSTCTLLERENEAVVRGFLSDHPEFTAESFILPAPVGQVENGMLTLWPHIHGTDGFFIAKLRKNYD